VWIHQIPIHRAFERLTELTRFAWRWRRWSLGKERCAENGRAAKEEEQRFKGVVRFFHFVTRLIVDVLGFSLIFRAKPSLARYL
jgi:hypothetical protein